MTGDARRWSRQTGGLNRGAAGAQLAPVTTVAIAAMMSIRERESIVRDISPFLYQRDRVNDKYTDLLPR
jgi:hypothetical protein